MLLKGYKELRREPGYTAPLPTDAQFIADELDLLQPEMAEVRQCIGQDDAEGARDAYLRLIAGAGTKRYYFDPADVPAITNAARTLYADDADARRDVEEADRIVAGDIPIFKGRRAVFPNGAYDWNSWLFDSSQYQLHLTRFAYVKRLSRAYALTGDEKYARCFNDMMAHFIDDNPVPVDGTFRAEHCTWDPLSVGVRLFTLPEAFVVFFGSASFKPDVKMKMIKSFFQHGKYVREYHARHGNHVCMQLRGLVQLSLLLPELKASRAWLDYALTELPAYVRQNVFEDGVQIEASPNYHFIVMRDLYELVPLLEKAGEEAAIYRETLEKMFEVAKHLCTPDGQLLRYGDTDKTDETELRNAMSTGACLFARGDFKFLGHARLPFALLWRFGPDAADRYARIEAAPPDDLAACFPVGGYLASRQSWDRDAMHMAMRAGLGIAGHAHSDALSVILFAGGRELVCDSGMGLFEWNKERKYAVSTRAHNTVVVDGQDQHVRGLHWNTPQTAACKIWDTRHEDRYDYWFASHYGYTRYDDPVVHSRKVLFVKNRYWLIVDLFKAEERHRYEQYFHLPAGEAALMTGGGRIRTLLPDANALLLFPKPGDGADDSLALVSGLIFREGRYEANPVAKRLLAATGSVALETIVLPYEGNPPRVDAVRLPVSQAGRELKAWEATGLRITGEGWTDELCLFHGSVPVESYLDHTGNIVGERLLPKSTPGGELLLEGRPVAGDVHLASI